AAFVRSPYAHARVTDVDVTDALDVDGLVAVYTYEDLDGRVAEPLPLLIPHPSLHAPRTGYPLANGIVRHVGEPVVMVVAVDRSVRVYSSTQTSTSVRFAVAAKLGIPVDRVEVVTPDVGGGFGVKIVHPWPEEVLVPWAAIRLGRPVKWTEDRREHFISSAHERAQTHAVDVGFDDDGRLHGLSVTFAHD